MRLFGFLCDRRFGLMVTNTKECESANVVQVDLIVLQTSYTHVAPLQCVQAIHSPKQMTVNKTLRPEKGIIEGFIRILVE